MDLVAEFCEVSPGHAAAMQHGLDTMNQSNARVIVSGQFVRTVQRLDPKSGPYDTERSTGVVGARTLSKGTTSVIVVNAAEFNDRPDADLERLLAHEAGHVTLNARREVADYGEFSRVHCTGGALLHLGAAVVIDEYRVERSVAHAGYELAENATMSAIDNQLFHMSCSVFEALLDPKTEDVEGFAAAVLSSLQPIVVTLGYLAGHVSAGEAQFDVAGLSGYGRQSWVDLMEPTWHALLELFNDIPPAGAPYSATARKADLSQTVTIYRTLLSDLGFRISFGAGPGDAWEFVRTGSDEIFSKRLKQLQSEILRRDHPEPLTSSG